MIYLDYAANHPAEPEVLARFCAVESAFPGNPNSAHPAGRAAKAELERVTASAAELLGAKPEEIIFTSGTTEANNLAIKGLARASRHVGRHIISTALEHSSVSGSLTCLQEQGYEIDLVPIGRDGRVDPEEFRALLRPDTVLAAVTAVDSELGVVQPIREMREILKDFPNCRLHVDATQAIGRIPFSFKGLDTMALAAHKFGGINGSGILVKRAELVLEPQMHGGVSATLYRSGTPALALDASTELALRMALEGRERHWAHAERLNRRLREELSSVRACASTARKGRCPTFKYKRGRHPGRGLSARAGGTGGLRVGQVGLLRGGYLPGGVCCEPRPEKRPVLVAHQPELAHHRQGDHRISAAV